MRVGMIDVDGHNWPNLCLMKLSAYHKARGDDVGWWSDDFTHYDLVYKAKVFTEDYTPDTEDPGNVGKLIKGGTGYGLDGCLPDAAEHIFPDYTLYQNPRFKNTAFGFLTRGCPRACPFCIVSQKEGRVSRKVADLQEFWSGQRCIKLLDPNLLACAEHETLLRQLADCGAMVDFTQGLDARLVTPENAHALSLVKTKQIHFAFDFLRDEAEILRGLKLYKKVNGIDSRKLGVYILTNFDTIHEQDLYRIRRVQELGFLPYVMVYQKNTAPKITRELQRWSNNRIIYRASGEDFGNYMQAWRVEVDGQVKISEEVKLGGYAVSDKL